MSKSLFILLLFQFLNILSQKCIENENYCKKCNLITNLCINCEFKVLTPDEEGGCKGAKKCKLGENYCDLCDEEEKLCKECEIGLFPDENGGCSYTDNCELSYKGQCIKCKNDFILIGKENNLKICKSLLTKDLKNCKAINTTTGLCDECEENFYLNEGDKRCTKTENCYESNFDFCSKCISGYYFDKKKEVCIKQENQFLHCKITLNGQTCQECDDDYYFDEEEKCTNTKFCSKSENNKCKECINNYYLTEDGQSCSSVKNCYKADKETGICDWCSQNYYLKKNELKCFSDEEKKEYKYCKIVSNECEKCENGYKLGEDGRCTKTNNCAESENGNCIQCSEGYLLGLDGKCTDKEHCIYSTINGNCIECEDGYVWDNYNQICKETDNKFKNCRLTLEGVFCADCKKNYYLDLSDRLCYDNTKVNEFYKCTKVSNKVCQDCEEGYFYGYNDNKCNKIENCVQSEDENTCLKCKQYYCLDLKNGKCVENEKILKEENKFFFRCEKTNKEGTACEKCEEGLILSNGLCNNLEDCVEEKNNVCLKCENTKYSWLNSCINDIFGCVDTYAKNCLKCNNFLDFNWCTECLEGFNMNEKGECS